MIMKLPLLKVGLLTCLATGLFYEEAFAESEWTSKCEAYGEVKPNENPSVQQVNCLLTNAAVAADIPPEVVKAVATQENGGWRQFTNNGEAVISSDGGIGLMQITNQPGYDQEQLKNDIYYNIDAGIKTLNSMYARTSTDLPKIKDAGRQVIENWYFPVMAYNGIKPVNSPISKLTGLENKTAYQEKVFAHIEKHSFLNGTKLTKFPFSSTDFQYNPSDNKNIEFLKKEYTLTGQTHESAYLFKAGDKVAVTTENVNLRPQPGTAQKGITLSKNTTLIVTGQFVFDQNANSQNQFVWYPVKTADQKNTGYISSAYLIKASETTTTDISFTDVDKTDRFYDDIYSISEKGIISGFPDGTFRPEEKVTRAQAAIMISRALKLSLDSTVTPFKDVTPSVSGAEHIAAAHKQGIITGFPGGEFRPKLPVNRGDMAIILSRAFKLQGTTDKTFSDVTKSMKSYDSIQRIIAAKITFGYDDNTFKPNNGITRGEFSALLNRALQYNAQ
ncbi:S-layer homology domain-containing protein [Peribacillus sp. NPDC096379]|uniref:S-layer homology domain-containing protein n=1 Tax=Peribacillus sp. NPDC096379 TaxID=3364393 RepID=UPI003809DE05